MHCLDKSGLRSLGFGVERVLEFGSSTSWPQEEARLETLEAIASNPSGPSTALQDGAQHAHDSSKSLAAAFRATGVCIVLHGLLHSGEADCSRFGPRTARVLRNAASILQPVRQRTFICYVDVPHGAQLRKHALLFRCRKSCFIA